jgi:hypothetical protein
VRGFVGYCLKGKRFSWMVEVDKMLKILKGDSLDRGVLRMIVALG